MRAALVVLAFAALTACAQTQGEVAPDPERGGARDVADIILQALPETQNRDWGYRWDAVSTRVSGRVHWHIYAPDARDRPDEFRVERNGWLSAGARQIGVSVFGTDERVTMLSFEYAGFSSLELLEGLRVAGATVSFQSDYETYSEYIVTPPGRATGVLTMRRTCTPERAALAQRCQDSAELTFEPLD